MIRFLYFSNDLLVFTKGNIYSIFAVQNLIFQRVKSTVLGSIIVEVTGLKIGKLPVRYLGVPLVARNLRCLKYSFSLLKSSSRLLKFVTPFFEQAMKHLQKGLGLTERRFVIPKQREIWESMILNHGIKLI
ncbi:BTB/POZ domain-containing protein [Gossypium australe]|uniref:BTB/POZ domain-containing protein n=1 Tax=Gossypium australe TaxID=47621 RepID=A0A5B6WJU2_9ROSI|nr:BTB/POZ domain-containing protein [Gossypium australe]